MRSRRAEVIAPGSHPALGETTKWDTWSRPLPWGRPDVIFVCVPDQAIAEVADRLADSGEIEGATVFHTSGMLPAQVLSPCRTAAAALGSWHPLQSFPPAATGEVVWDDICCAVEGDPTAVETGSEIARTLGLHPWPIDAKDKERYHAAAAVAGNLVHILVAEAARAMRRCGLPGPRATAALEPMIVQSIRAALRARGLEALTGPIARGDRDTIERHLASLPPQLATAYRQLVLLAMDRLPNIRIELTDGAANRN